MRDAGRQLAERRELLGLDEAVLRGPQILKRSLQVACLGADFVEQADILDGDHGLICEGPEELDLLFAEGPHLEASDHDHSDRLFVAHQRRRGHGTVTVPEGHRFALGKFVTAGEEVVDVLCLALGICAAGERTVADRQSKQSPTGTGP